MDKENDCVIISMAGDLEIDFQALSEKMGDQMQGATEADIHVTDSKMTGKTCWDNEAKMATWTETHMMLKMHMKNPSEPENELEVPIREVIKTTCQVKERN